jgi:DNA-binding MarR family transcriptional regulator
MDGAGPRLVVMAETRSDPGLQGDDLRTWVALATVMEWLPVALDEQLQRTAGLSHFEYGVLFALSQAPEGRLRMSVLAGYANSSLSRLSRAVTRLERQGWVRREADPADGRSTLTVLTPEGRARYDLATPGHADTVQRLVLAPLTRAQQRQLREVAGRIAAAVRDEPGWTPPVA